MWKELFRESVKIEEKTLRTKLYGMTFQVMGRDNSA